MVLRFSAPFALSLSKGLPFFSNEEEVGFDKLSPNGFVCLKVVF